MVIHELKKIGIKEVLEIKIQEDSSIKWLKDKRLGG